MQVLAWFTGSVVLQRGTSVGHVGFLFFFPRFTREPTFDGRCQALLQFARWAALLKWVQKDKRAETMGIRVGGLVYRGQGGLPLGCEARCI